MFSCGRGAVPPLILPCYMSANIIHDLGVLMTQPASPGLSSLSIAALGVKLQYFLRNWVLTALAH